jgi:hypothetical protein
MLDREARSTTGSDYGSSTGLSAARSTVSVDDLPESVTVLLKDLKARGIQVSDRATVLAYLAGHSDLVGTVERVSQAAADRLGARSELSLEIVRDPESGGQHLVLLARQQAYEPDLLRVLGDIMDAHWHPPADASGWFHLSTDFQPPRHSARGL